MTESLSVEGPVLAGIPVSTEDTVYRVAAMRRWFSVPEGASYQVLRATGQPAVPTDPIATGMHVVVTAQDGTVLIDTTVVVMGEVLGTGIMNIAQIVRAAQDLNGTRALTGPYLAAADFNGNGFVDISDLVRMAWILTDATGEPIVRRG